ncbi:MAG: hypothetical protein JXR25_15170 [Pontiellaceae bacterium]|nr:hypothetical protein [Pontiellaceae bacterium]MBN2786161.1 hypothetical protein [Pontiellaceae bacterium]
MKNNSKLNVVMLVVAAVVLLGADVSVWMAAQNGIIKSAGNTMLWGAFLALNLVSILWAVSMLGLQPLVVALSYVGGGFLAFKGVQGVAGVSVAEITTAGATYGAFGALAASNVTTKVRFALYQKGQVPFIFIIIALLVIDAGLNSGVSGAGGSVLLSAVVFPFILAGVSTGLVWTIAVRFGIGARNKKAVVAVDQSVDQSVEEVVEEIISEPEDTPMIVQMPEPLFLDDENEDLPAIAAELAEELNAPALPLVEKAPMTPADMIDEAVADDFIPIEIDNSAAYELSEPAFDLDREEEQDEIFSVSGFDSSLYASGTSNNEHVGVMVDEPVTTVSVELDQASVAALQEKAEAVVQQAEPVRKKAKEDDWLSGHLDLLSKLK